MDWPITPARHRASAPARSPRLGLHLLLRRGAAAVALAVVALAVCAALALPAGAAVRVTTLAGKAHESGDTDGLGTKARFGYPGGLVCDAAGNVLVVENFRYTVRKITPRGRVKTVAGTATARGHVDAVGAAARFEELWGIACNGATGVVFVAEYGNQTIRRINSAMSVTTWAGGYTESGSADAFRKAARFNVPLGMVHDPVSGSLFVADSDNHTIRRISANGAVSTFAGWPGARGYADGIGGTARFARPQALASDRWGNIYVVDGSYNLVRKITPAGVVTTLAGVPGPGGHADGPGSTARFDNARGVACDAAGNVYVADAGNFCVRKITPAGYVTTIAGKAGEQGVVNGLGPNARFGFLNGLACNAHSILYVADSYNTLIRRIQLDDARPTTRPGRDVTVTAGHRARMTFRVQDQLPSSGKAKAVLQFWRGDRLVRSVSAGTVKTNAFVSLSWTVKLRRGSYRWRVAATDIAGNEALRRTWATLTVR